MANVKRVDIFEDIYVQDSGDIDVSNLARMLGVQQKELAAAFSISESKASRKGVSTSNYVMKQWLIIFNLVIDIIEAASPTLSKNEIQTKMSRILKMPESHFGNKSLLDVMLAGKSRKVIKFLEQLAA